MSLDELFADRAGLADLARPNLDRHAISVDRDRIDQRVSPERYGGSYIVDRDAALDRRLR